MPAKESRPRSTLRTFDLGAFLDSSGVSRRIVRFARGEIIFTQGDMNKFRKLGFIEYNGGLKINSALLSIVLHDDPTRATWPHPALPSHLPPGGLSSVPRHPTTTTD